MMFCPNCGQESTFTEHQAYVRNVLGLSQDEGWGMDNEWQSWLTCDNCGAHTDEQELDALNRRYA